MFILRLAKRVTDAVQHILRGRGNHGSLEDDEGVDYIEPLSDAFDASEIGPGIDWKSLSQVDRDFLQALYGRDAAGAKAAFAAGARAFDCGHGCNALMLAAATADEELVSLLRAEGVTEGPESEAYFEVLEFSERAKTPSFTAALAEIERLTGEMPQPAERAQARCVSLPEKAAADFLLRHHERLFDMGCYVFRYGRQYDKRRVKDVLWILPTKDPFAVMAFTGVSGMNYDIENHLVMHWMKQLQQDQPFVMTDCRPDLLSGRFKAPIADVDAMAKRMYAFCPDIVDQGTETVAQLAKELRETNRFFFWWD